MGDQESLDALEKVLRSRYDLKVTGELRLDEDKMQEVIFLNRVLRLIMHNGQMQFEIEADPRHSEMIVRDVGLGSEAAKAVATPEAKKDEVDGADRDRSPPLEGEDVRLYRSITMRAAYLAPDRADLGNAVKNLAKNMHCPRRCDMERLKRLARYIKGKPRVVQVYRRDPGEKRHEATPITIMVDSDNAGDKVSRRSTVGQAAYLGKHVVKHACNLLQVIGLSSGEN